MLSAEGRTKRSAETARDEVNRVVHTGTKLQIFQLNVRKRDVVQLSMMNDQDLQQYAVLAVAEPSIHTNH